MPLLFCSNRSDRFLLHHNGILQDSQPCIPQFAFELTTDALSTKDVIFIGGIPESVAFPGMSSNISFRGCMRNLVFNYK